MTCVRRSRLSGRIFLDFFQRLSSCGVNVDQFQYTGMGSIHFVDHILFHKFLGVRNLVSVEGDSSISRRVQFNCPYRNVAIELMSISDYIPKLNPSCTAHCLAGLMTAESAGKSWMTCRIAQVFCPLGRLCSLQSMPNRDDDSTGVKDNYKHFRGFSIGTTHGVNPSSPRHSLARECLTYWGWRSGMVPPDDLDWTYCRASRFAMPMAMKWRP